MNGTHHGMRWLFSGLMLACCLVALCPRALAEATNTIKLIPKAFPADAAVRFVIKGDGFTTESSVKIDGQIVYST